MKTRNLRRVEPTKEEISKIIKETTKKFFEEKYPLFLKILNSIKERQ